MQKRTRLILKTGRQFRNGEGSRNGMRKALAHKGLY